MYHWLSADQVLVWMGFVLAASVGLVVAPVLATLRIGSPGAERPGDPYRDAADHAGATPSGDRGRGSLLVLAGIVHVLLVPLGLVAALLQGFSLASGGGDGPGVVVIFVAAVVAAPTAIAVLRAAVATLRARPCTRINAAALVLAQGVLVAAAVLAIGRESSLAVAALAALVMLVVWIGLARLVLRPVPTADDEPTKARARLLLVLSNAALALVLAFGGGFALWVGDELGDRLSNLRAADEGAAWYQAVQGPTFVLGGLLVALCLADVALAIVAARARPNPAS
jgi:hypothetical protein